MGFKLLLVPLANYVLLVLWLFLFFLWGNKQQILTCLWVRRKEERKREEWGGKKPQPTNIGRVFLTLNDCKEQDLLVWMVGSFFVYFFSQILKLVTIKLLSKSWCGSFFWCWCYFTYLNRSTELVVAIFYTSPTSGRVKGFQPFTAGTGGGKGQGRVLFTSSKAALGASALLILFVPLWKS